MNVRRDLPADLLRRRVGGAELGPLLLDGLELAQPLVEVGVGQGRVVEHVVAPAGVLDLFRQPLMRLARLLQEHGPHLAASGRHRPQGP